MDGGGTSAAKTSPNDIGKWTLSEPRESNLSQKEQRVYLGLLDRFAGYSSGQPFKNTQGRYSVPSSSDISKELHGMVWC